jgi:NAD(P)-dependent dehydrogenase (short-subunit alcohol dehydrogenase family)
VNAAGERVAIVTGASAGIGLYTALGLARQGMRVVLVGRDPARTERARRLVAERSGSGALDTALADFASLAAVRRLADALLADYDRIDLLVNNAGFISPHFQLSEDGYELTVAVNHLAPFLLTNLLLDRLRASAQTNRMARIVTVASQAHRGARLNIAALTRPQDWTPLSAYGRSKLCNVLFTRALARRLDATQVTTACLHPGVVATAIGDRAGAIAGFGWRLIKPFLISPERGAATSLFLAAVPDPTPFHGAYVVGKRIAEPDAAARDDRLAEELWAESTRLVGLPASAAAGA